MIRQPSLPVFLRALATLLVVLTGFASLAEAKDDPLAELEQQIGRPHHKASHPAPIHHEYIDPHVHPEPHLHGEAHHPLEAFSHGFIQRALLAGLLAGGLCAWLGVFIVLRRMVFVGIALAQVASCGVAFAVFAGLDPVTVALLTTLTFAIYDGMSSTRGELSTEARIGLVYLLAGGLSVILLAKSGTGEGEQLEMLQGSLLTVSSSRLVDLALLAAAVFLIHVFGRRQLIAVSFDPVGAQVVGVNGRFWNLLLLATLGTSVSLTVQSCGLLLVFGYLLIPPATGLLSGLRLPGVFCIGLVSQALSTAMGLLAAYELDLPPGPAIVVTMLIFLVIVPSIVRLCLHRKTLHGLNPSKRPVFEPRQRS